jgi:hypothetical protein
MAELPPDLPDETTPPQEQPLLVAEALSEMSGIPLSEFEGLTPEQLDTLFDDPDVNEEIYLDPTNTEKMRQKNAEVIRRKISVMRTS